MTFTPDSTRQAIAAFYGLPGPDCVELTTFEPEFPHDWFTGVIRDSSGRANHGAPYDIGDSVSSIHAAALYRAPAPLT